MKIIIAGGRKFQDYNLLKLSIDKFIRENDMPKETIYILGGEAPGADLLGKKYAHQWGFKYKSYPALWHNLNTPGAVIKTNNYGKLYNARAGYDRNLKMALDGDWLIAFWDGYSPGTKNMIKVASEQRLGVTVIKFA